MSSLNKSLGVGMLTFYGVGMILGAGIYSVIGAAAAHAEGGLWLGFVLAGVIALFTGFSYAELASLYPKAGGEFIYLSQAFPSQKWISRVTGMAMFFSGSATAATVSMAFASYLRGLFPSVVPWLTATILIVLVSLINVRGIRESGWTNVVFTMIEVAGLILFITLAVRSDHFGDQMDLSFHSGILRGTSLILFAYFGFENIVNLAEESRNPIRDVPKAIFYSLGFAMILYILVSVSALALLPVDQLARTDTVLAEAAQKHSQTAARVLGAIALFSTANTALIAILAASRILYGMSKAGALPKSLAQVLPNARTPWLATTCATVVALALLPLGKIESLASVSSLMTVLAFTSVNVALIVLRRTQPETPRPFRSPFSFKGVPLLAACGGITALICAFQFKAEIYLICLSLLGFFFFYFQFKKS